MEWTDELVVTFIKNIQGHPCLWNPRDKNKKNRNKVQDAFQAISAAMDIEINELKKKKETLFQTYRNYRRKVACSQKSGAGTDDVYIPSWPPYFDLDAFLHGIYTPKGTFDTLVSRY
nr:unnamed protein product [Callosobruchus analis]